MKVSTLALALLIAPVCLTVPFVHSGIARPADDVNAAMQQLKTKLTALGPPSLKDTETLGLTPVPVLYFGETKMNNNIGFIDALQKEVGGTATIFVRQGDDFYRVTTNVKAADGTRAIGTVLDPLGKVIAALRKGDSFTGVVDVLGTPYTTRYEPIRDSENRVIGALYVGFQNEEQHAGYIQRAGLPDDR